MAATSTNFRFSKANFGIITDTQTGLPWYMGADEDTTWDQAQAWADSLTIEGCHWRLPTMVELRRLYDSGVTASNLGVFQNSGVIVWSGKLYSCSSAWFLGFDGGYEYWADRVFANGCRAWAVRIEILKSP